jgi:hypothetical protein
MVRQADEPMPSSSTLDVELSGRQSADRFDRQIFVTNDAGTTSDLLVGWQESPDWRCASYRSPPAPQK